jgi:hypothetical protein
MEVVLLIRAAERDLTRWLEAHTARVARRAFPTPEGDIHLHALRDLGYYSSAIGPIGMHGVITPRERRRRQREVLFAIRFAVMALDPMRTELRISTDWPALAEYVDELVTAIEQRWRVTRPGDASHAASTVATRVSQSCSHSTDLTNCSVCTEFLEKVTPLLTIGDRKPRQEDVARSLGYTTRHIRRLCEGLGYHAWSDFYTAVRSGKLSVTP